MLTTDYLIIGSGAVGMAFADTLLSETEANIIIVDRYEQPGGHWNQAYPFVTLHQPSQFYGVSSKELGSGKIDKQGLNKGLFSLASGAEVCSYYQEVMQETFLPTGRVKYFPSCEYVGNHEFKSLLTNEKHQVGVRKKLVDCTFLKTSIPATHTPSFSFAEGVNMIPLNELPKVATTAKEYCVIGGGKTGIDACLWLLENQVDADCITWIVSRDGWLIDRQNTQPTEAFFEYTFGAVANQTEAIVKAKNIPDLFKNLEEKGVLVRLDKTVIPKMFHGATVSSAEIETLRRIQNVVRMGRVQRIEKDNIVLDQGRIPIKADCVHVDCSASAIKNVEAKPIFEKGKITPQTVRSYQPIFSAATIAFVEAHYTDDTIKNSICQVVPLPDKDTSWIHMMLAQMTNQFVWGQHKKLKTWLNQNRLNGFGNLIARLDKNDIAKMEVLSRIRKNSMPAMMKLQYFVTQLEAEEQAKIATPQFQVDQKVFFRNGLVEIPKEALEIADGDILVKIEKFAYTANNITYAAVGDQIGYWKFFSAAGKCPDGWGVIPVWGFAEVVQTKVDEISVGEKLFGYFPPAKFLKLKPGKIATERFFDTSPHRLALPAGYNLYRRVENEPNYNPAFDRELMLLFPLHLTSFFLWDALKEEAWHGAEQIVILSASSKTSTGLGYALKADTDAPEVIGVTSSHNLAHVENLALYDQCLTYEQATSIDATVPTVIVDMSGNTKVLEALHLHLKDQMKFTQNVGITHWASAKPRPGIIAERSKFFFAPGRIQKRMKEWGPREFHEKTSGFITQTAIKTKAWLQYKELNSLQELAAIHPLVCSGKIPSNQGIIVTI